MLDREKVANALATQRKMKGLTQRQLADILNVSYQAISRWEQGLSLPSVDMIYDIAQTLETSVDFLLNGLSAEKRNLTYADTGLDTKKLHLAKDRLGKLVTDHELLLHACYTEPVFLKADTAQMEEPVYVFANHVPGSKERFAMRHGYDREICLDVAANAANNLIRFGVKPTLLQAHIVCGNNDSGQLLTMGEAFREFCDHNHMLFAGMEVAAQAVNYPPSEYKLSALVTGTIDRKDILMGKDIAAGDVIIGLHTDGIYGTSYPFIKVMLDQKPDMLDIMLDERHTLMDALNKPNVSYVNVITKLIEKKLIHGTFAASNSLYDKKSYSHLPKGLCANIRVSSIPCLPLFRYLYDLHMMDKESFLHNFSLGIGMLVVVPKKQCGEAVSVIEQYHKCNIIGQIEESRDELDRKVRLEGSLKW